MLLFTRQRDTLSIRLKGDLDHRAAERLRGEIDALIADPGIRRLVLDLEEVEFMDSSGIGLIIGRYKRMQKRGGSVAVARADRCVSRILEMSGLYQIIERMA